MRILFLILYLFLFQTLLFSQAIMDVFDPLMDNARSFTKGEYDIALIKKNKVETFQVNDNIYYFDTSGRVKRIVSFIEPQSIKQEERFEYNSNGDRVAEELTSNKMNRPVQITFFKTYEQSRLICDSSSIGEACTHWEYDNNGNLRKETWRMKNHVINRVFWFDVDRLGRRTRIIDRQYGGAEDTTGRLLSDRTMIYDQNGKVIREDETVNVDPCFNYGSTTYKYDRSDRLVEIARTNGLSQKIKYKGNGLIDTVETKGKLCGGKEYVSKWKYRYTYRK